METPAPTRTHEAVRVRPYVTWGIEPLTAAVQASLDNLRPWFPWAHATYDRADAQAWADGRAAWENDEAYSFSIVHTETGRFLGGVGINRIDWPSRVGTLLPEAVSSWA